MKIEKEGDLIIDIEGRVFIRGTTSYSKRYPYHSVCFLMYRTPMTLVQEENTHD